MLPSEHSAILLTFSKLPFVIKIFVLSIFEWPFYSVFTDPKIFMTNGSLMKVKGNAECFPWRILQNFDLHLAIAGLEKPILGIFESGRFTQVLLYSNKIF